MAQQTIAEVDDLDGFNAALTAVPDGQLVVVKYAADWCKNCTRIAPALERAARALHGSATFIGVDVDVADEVALEQGVTTLPRLMFLRGGEKVDDYIGSDVGEIQSRLSKLLPEYTPQDTRRACHWVLKVGNLKTTLDFLEQVLHMKVLRHEEFESGCEATCNGPYAGRWSKTMVGYGPEEHNFALELTYNYGIESYAFGNDLQCIMMQPEIKGVDLAAAVSTAEALGFSTESQGDAGAVLVHGPDNVNFLLLPPLAGRTEAFVGVRLRTNSVADAEAYWCGLLGLYKFTPPMHTAPADGSPMLTVGYNQKEALLQFVEVQDGQQVDHALSAGRIAFACTSVQPIFESVDRAGDEVINPPLTLATEGKADVVVTILASRSDKFEICFVEEEGFYQLATPTYDEVDFAERALSGADGHPAPSGTLTHGSGLEDIEDQPALDALLASAASQGKPAVVVDFAAGWCKACRDLMPQIEAMARKYSESTVFATVDISEAEDLAEAHSVQGVPFFQVYVDGTLRHTHKGKDLSKVEALLSEALPDDRQPYTNQAAHWVFKVGNLKQSMRFYELVFGMRTLRHEEFESGCEATCNGPYAGQWSKTMVGFGPEEHNFVFELTYNYGIDGYTFGNDLQYIGLAVPGARERAEAFGYPVVKEYRNGVESVFVVGPDRYRYKLLDEVHGRAERVACVALRVASLERALDYYCNVLGAQQLAVLPGMEHPDPNACVGWDENQVRLQLIEVSDGQPVDHALSSGRVAFVCKSVEPYFESSKATGDTVVNEPLWLKTDGKADVVVTILKDRDDYEICFVQDVGFWELAQPTWDVIDWHERRQRGADGAPPPSSKKKGAKK